ncbi:leukocyte immunoglobulin-like receptor subfamily A (with TM domain) member 5 [Cricetulus griseus]
MSYDRAPHFFSGNPPKPTLSVQSGSVVARGKQVTISCEVTTGAREYRLYKEGGPHPWRSQNTPEATNKAEFLIPSIEQQHGGRYRCYYKTPAGWSEHSDPLELVVTGFYSKPSLSVQASPVVVTPGETVTLQCGSQLGFSRFVLTKEGERKPSLILDSVFINSTGQFQGLFSVGPVNSSQRWTFRCYGYQDGQLTSPTSLAYFTKLGSESRLPLGPVSTPRGAGTDGMVSKISPSRGQYLVTLWTT